MNKKERRKIHNQKVKQNRRIHRELTIETENRKRYAGIRVGFLMQENIDHYASNADPLPCVLCEAEITGEDVAKKKLIGFYSKFDLWRDSYFAHLKHFYDEENNPLPDSRTTLNRAMDVIRSKTEEEVKIGSTGSYDVQE